MAVVATADGDISNQAAEVKMAVHIAVGFV